jgi:hypothetical protein
MKKIKNKKEVRRKINEEDEKNNNKHK